MSGADAAVAAGLAWLAAAQLPSGELPAYATPLGDAPREWLEDRLNFITALAAEALDEVADPAAVAVVDRAVAFLARERLPTALWRYWSHENERVELTPPDADDTACCSLAVGRRGADTSANHRVLLATTTPEGRFHTWLILHPSVRDLRVRWRLRGERRAETRAWRAELWSSTEADPDDVDAVVNANVCRYLGPVAPAGAVRWVAEVAAAGEDTHDKWHRRLPTLWAAVADGARRGIEPFQAVRGSILDQIEAHLAGPEPRALDLALATLAVQRFDGPSALVAHGVEALLERQGADGAWDRDLVYFGGPDEVFGWGSEALTTAWAVAALHGAARSV